MWSQRFGKGEEKEILNELIEHDGQNAGDIKTKYKIKNNIDKNKLKELLNIYNSSDVKKLIDLRLDNLNGGITEEQEEFFYKLVEENNLLTRPPHMSSGRIYYQIYPKKNSCI